MSQGVVFGFNRWLALNTGTSVGFGTYGTADSTFYITSGPWTRSIERQPNTDEYTGYEEDTSSGTGRVLAASVQGPLGGRATPHIIGLLGCAALGSWSSATAGTLGTAATAYKHKIRPIKVIAGTAGAGTLPNLTSTESLSGNSSIQFDYRDCVTNSFGLSASRKAWVEYTAELVGSGVWRASTLAKPAVITETYLKAGDCTFFLGTALAATPAQSKGTPDVTGTAYGTAIAITGKIVSFAWTVNNNLKADESYGMNSGTTRDRMDRGQRTQTLSLTAELYSAAQLALLENQTEMALEIECYNNLIESDAYYGFNLGFPQLVVLSAVPSGAPGDKMTMAWEFQVQEDTTAGSVLLDVYNTRSAYLQ